MIWQALAGVPVLSQAEWQDASGVHRWLVASRASVLPLTLGSALFAIGLVWPEVRGLDAVLVLAALLAAHATNNLLNDHVDYRAGLDRGNYFRAQYGTHPLSAGWLNLEGHRRYVLITGSVAFALACLVVLRAGSEVLLPAVLGALLLLFYTWPLKRLALGEVSVWLAWGPLMICGVVLALGGTLDQPIIVAASVYGLGPLLVIMAKHTDKIEDDRERGVVTVPVLLGERVSRAVMVGVLVLQLVGACALGSFWYLLVFLALPQAWRLLRMLGEPRPALAPDGPSGQAWPLWFTAAAFLYARLAGFTLVVAAFAA